MLDIYGMVVPTFSVVDKANQVRFFEKTFLMAKVSSEVVFRIFFFTMSGANVDFSKQELRWRTYITEEAFPTTKYVKLVGKKEFATAALNQEPEIYVVYVASFSSTSLVASLGSTPLNVYPFRRPQIFVLITKETLTKIFNKYADFEKVFSVDLSSKIFKYTRIYNYTIKLFDGQQPPYSPIYSLGPVNWRFWRLILRSIQPIVLLDYPSPLLILPSSLTKSQTVFSNCALIFKTSTTLQSRIGTCLYWFGSCWTG